MTAVTNSPAGCPEPKFDWYAATIPQHPEAVTDDLLDNLPLEGGYFAPSRPMFGFSAAEILEDAQGKRLTVLWGGDKGYDKCHIVATGEDAQVVAQALRHLYPEHHVTRIDSAFDFLGADLYAQFHDIAKLVAEMHPVQVSEIRPIEDQFRGSTTYVGSPRSAVRSRLYEKGKQLGHDPAWVRAEIQFRPAKEERTAAANLTPAQVWGVSRWSVDLGTLLLGRGIEPQDIRVHRKSTFEKTHAAMLQQYGQHLTRYAQLLGSWTCLGQTLEHDLRGAAHD